MFRVVIGSIVALVLAGCGQPSATQEETIGKNFVRSTDVNNQALLGSYGSFGSQVAKEALESGRWSKAGSEKAAQRIKALGLTDRQRTDEVVSLRTPIATSGLLYGFPVDQLGEQVVFGGVITQVDAVNDENLGSLKLSDLPMLHGKLVLADTDPGHLAVLLIGCQANCTENSPQELLLGIPVVAVDETLRQVILDLGALAQDLDLVSILDPEGEGTGLKTIATESVAADYSQATLVFDIASKMIPKDSDPSDPSVTPVTFTSRWYIKQASSFNPAFSARSMTDGVGYFMTERSASPKITRFSLTRFGASPIKYYVKNVPVEFRPAFASAIENWNETYKNTLGISNVISYEFLDAADPRNQYLVPGDVRYNIIEWDLVNKAPYGGLGPSIANQFTGQTISANVLIQGPTIVDIYTEWYKAAAEISRLKASGRQDQAEQAEALELAFIRKHSEKIGVRAKRLGAKRTLKLNQGAGLVFRVPSDEVALEDPVAQRGDFDLPPSGMTYETYMFGYFHDMLAHELGHNLGLRHNFRGNLGADDDGIDHGTRGSVSRSIMEYLNRKYRHLDLIGPYDAMAIAYGYAGTQPAVRNWFCTDDQVATPGDATTSAECSRDDATSDPFRFFEGRISKAIDYLAARGRTTAPVWTIPDLTREIGIGTNGLLSYGQSAEKTSAGWTAFFGKAGRPQTAAEVPAFVAERLSQQLCDPNLALVIENKEGTDAKLKTQQNLDELRAAILALSAPFKPLFDQAGIDLTQVINCTQ